MKIAKIIANLLGAFAQTVTEGFIFGIGVYLFYSLATSMGWI